MHVSFGRITTPKSRRPVMFVVMALVAMLFTGIISTLIGSTPARATAPISAPIQNVVVTPSSQSVGAKMCGPGFHQVASGYAVSFKDPNDIEGYFILANNNKKSIACATHTAIGRFWGVTHWMGIKLCIFVNGACDESRESGDSGEYHKYAGPVYLPNWHKGERVQAYAFAAPGKTVTTVTEYWYNGAIFSKRGNN